MSNIFSKKTKVESSTDNMSSLSHTKWNCKYHIVFLGQPHEKSI